MRYDYSMRLRDDVTSAVQKAVATAGIVKAMEAVRYVYAIPAPAPDPSGARRQTN